MYLDVSKFSSHLERHGKIMSLPGVASTGATTAGVSSSFADSIFSSFFSSFLVPKPPKMELRLREALRLLRVFFSSLAATFSSFFSSLASAFSSFFSSLASAFSSFFSSLTSSFLTSVDFFGRAAATTGALSLSKVDL